MVGKGVEHWAGRSGVSFRRGDIGRPGEIMTRGVSRNHMAWFERWGDDVEKKDPEVPNQYEQIDELGSDCVQ